jgi:hypothetical protein
MRSATRLGIVRRALEDVMKQLDTLPATPETSALRGRVTAHRERLESWQSTPPTPEERVGLMQTVIDLQLEVMMVAREQGNAFETDTGIRARRKF